MNFLVMRVGAGKPESLQKIKKSASAVGEIISSVFALFVGMLLIITFIAITGCDEGVKMANGVIIEPATNGEVKQPVEPTEPAEPIEPAEPPEPPTLTIAVTTAGDDGSITVSGTSVNLPKGTKVTVTIDDTVTATAKTNKAGNWSVTVPADEAQQLTAGTAEVTAVAEKVSDTGSVTIPEPPTLTIAVATAGDDGSITVSGTSADLPQGTTVTVTVGDTVTATATTDSAGAWSVTVPADKVKQLSAGVATVTATAENISDTGSVTVPEPPSEEENLEEKFRQQYEPYNFSEEVVERLVHHQIERIRVAQEWDAGKISDETLSQKTDALYEEAFGISIDYAGTLRNIYVQETGEKRLLRGADAESIGIAYLIVKKDHPDAEGKAFEELFRQYAREGLISITFVNLGNN